MNKILAALVLVSMVAAVGCNNNKKTTQPTATNSAVTDITPAPQASTPAYTPAPAYSTPAPSYTPATPVVSDVTTTPSTPAVSSGTTYTVKKGDTLFAIAKSHYGPTGVSKNVEKIIAANPGLTAANLKAGQKITIP